VSLPNRNPAPRRLENGRYIILCLVTQMLTGTILDKIVQHKRQQLRYEMRDMPLSALKEQIADLPPPCDFTASLQGPVVAVIAEIKPASPSAGELAGPLFDPRIMAQEYCGGGAAAISVLTERNYFHGEPHFIHRAKARIPLPILRKDFIFDPYQIYQSAALEADALLLIASILEPPLLRDLYDLTVEQGMTALVEVHNEAEMEQAGEIGAALIGINNRDLSTLKVDLAVTERLAPQAPEDALLVSESGIGSRQDVQRLAAAGIDAVLVGTTLMKSEEPNITVRALTGVSKQSHCHSA